MLALSMQSNQHIRGHYSDDCPYMIVLKLLFLHDFTRLSSHVLSAQHIEARGEAPVTFLSGPLTVRWLEVDKLVFEISDSDMSLTLIRIQTKNQIKARWPANSTYLDPRCQVELYYTPSTEHSPAEKYKSY